VEEGDSATIITKPRHPYTRALLDALPQGGERGQLRSIPGAPPSLINPPTGCRFAARCPLVTDECRDWDTELLTASDGEGHRVRCLRHEEVGSTAWQVTDSV
jgi:oligopeptide/dipeptide ABC transporter ATP-binding protein